MKKVACFLLIMGLVAMLIQGCSPSPSGLDIIKWNFNNELARLYRESQEVHAFESECIIAIEQCQKDRSDIMKDFNDAQIDTCLGFAKALLSEPENESLHLNWQTRISKLTDFATADTIMFLYTAEYLARDGLLKAQAKKEALADEVQVLSDNTMAKAERWYNEF